MTSLKMKRTHIYVRWIFLRLISLCFLAAFLSVAAQMLGLYGTHGILPIKDFLAYVNEKIGSLDGFINFPSIFWWNCSDGFMQVVGSLGVVVSLLALVGIFTGPSLFLCWFLYLSIVCVGQAFMSFQWDSLLLETGLLAVWFAPWGMQELHPFNRKSFEAQKEPSFLFLFLLRLLCFKLMLFSGICKLASGDVAWHNLTAMNYHYETQPLPTPLAWLTQKLPDPIERVSTLFVFLFELVLPAALITMIRPVRIVSATCFILLMIMIMFTGNYAFFNVLTIAISVTLLDDQCIMAIMPRSIKMGNTHPERSMKDWFWNTVISCLPGLLIAVCSLSYVWLMTDNYRGTKTLPDFLRAPLILSTPLRSFNSYGLFAIMTTTRPEIIVEGSNDGKTWLPYEFKWKPGDIHRAPPIVAPHQPRLDWQMWFASLGKTADQSPWFDPFVKRLLQDSPEVLRLLDKNPFPDGAPKQIRAVTYDYHFSDFNGLFQRGEWWTRSKEGSIFYPPTSLEELHPAQNTQDLSY